MLVSAYGSVSVKCRALLDGGSDCNLMTSCCRERLGLSILPTNINVVSLFLASHNVNISVKITLKSTCTDFQTDIQSLSVDRITSNLPPVDIDISLWYLPLELAHADPDFHLANPIDII